jgi:hypothetical protein
MIVTSILGGHFSERVAKECRFFDRLKKVGVPSGYSLLINSCIHQSSFIECIMAPSNTTYHTGLHDRRGFDSVLQFLMAALVLSILVLILYSWKLGLGMLFVFGVYYITIDSVSVPPENRPEKFIGWARNRPRRRPVLLCLGDSLTHGTLSASVTPEIPVKLSAALGMDPPSIGEAFVDPLWVVNAGQVNHLFRCV